MTRHRAWTIVRVLLTVAIFAYLLRDFDLAAARTALAGFSPALLAALVLLIAADRLLMLRRWILLMRMTTALPARKLARIFFVSSFVGSFLPAGVGGDAARAISVTRQTNQPGAAVASVVLDRLIGLLAVAVSGCVGVVIAADIATQGIYQLTVAASLMLLAGCIMALFADRLATLFIPHAWRESRIGRTIVGLGAQLSAYRHHPGILWRVAGLSLIVQAVRIGIAWHIGRGLAVPLPIRHYWVFMPLNILVTLLPLSVGGFGVPQGAMVWSLAPLGVSATQAFLLSMLFILSGIVSNIPGAVLYVMGRSRAT